MQFEKELFNGYRIHAYNNEEIILTVPAAHSGEDIGQPRDNLFRTAESFIVTRSELVKNWSLKNISQLEEHHLQPISALEPELVLIGTGKKQCFPSTRLLAEFYNQGIGVEIMDSAAACRTYNILAGEGRKVVAGIIID